MDYEVRVGWLLTIEALEKNVGRKGYMTIAEGWTMLMDGGSVDPEEASDALYLLEQDELVIVESEEEYNDFMHEYFPTSIELTEKGRSLLCEIKRHPVITAFLDGVKKVETLAKEIKEATPTIREAIKGVFNAFIQISKAIK